MADNTIINPGSGGDAIATDDIGGVKFQRVKVTHGADGSATDVSSASPLPVDTELPAAAALSDTTANPTAPMVGAAGLRYNGSTFDRERGNTEGALVLASAARTSLVNSADQYNMNGRGMRVSLYCSAKAGATSLDISIFCYDALTGYLQLGRTVTWTPSPATSFALDMYPGIEVASGAVQVSQSSAVPRHWVLNINPTDASSVTYMAQVAYIV